MTDQERIDKLTEIIRSAVEYVVDISDIVCNHCVHEDTMDFEKHCQMCKFELRHNTEETLGEEENDRFKNAIIPVGDAIKKWFDIKFNSHKSTKCHSHEDLEQMNNG